MFYMLHGLGKLEVGLHGLFGGNTGCRQVSKCDPNPTSAALAQRWHSENMLHSQGRGCTYCSFLIRLKKDLPSIRQMHRWVQGTTQFFCKKNDNSFSMVIVQRTAFLFESSPMSSGLDRSAFL